MSSLTATVYCPPKGLALSALARPFIRDSQLGPLIFLEYMLGIAYVRKHCPLSQEPPYLWPDLWPESISVHIGRIIRAELQLSDEGHFYIVYLDTRFGLDGLAHGNWTILNVSSAPDIVRAVYDRLYTEHGSRRVLPQSGAYCLNYCRKLEFKIKQLLAQCGLIEPLQAITANFSLQSAGKWADIKCQIRPPLPAQQLTIDSSLLDLLDWHRLRSFINEREALRLQRSLNCLEKNRIFTIRELVEIPEEQKPCRGFGADTRRIINTMLAPFHLRLGMSAAEIQELGRENLARISQAKR